MPLVRFLFKNNYSSNKIKLLNHSLTLYDPDMIEIQNCIFDMELLYNDNNLFNLLKDDRIYLKDKIIFKKDKVILEILQEKSSMVDSNSKLFIWKFVFKNND